MLETNGGCELPCWWGIVPGKTTQDAMVEHFAKQGIALRQEGQLDLGYLVEPRYREETLDVEFQQSNGVVQNISINAAYYYRLAQDEFDYAWREYTLAQMLSRYGPPSQVYLDLTTGAADWTPGMRQYYDLWLVYDKRGIAVRYPGVLIRDNPGWLLCPMFGVIDGIEIRLQSPGVERSIVHIESGEYGYGSFAGTLSELTDVSLEEFYESFDQVPPQGCLLISDPSPWWYDELTLPSAAIPLSPEHEDGLLAKMLTDNGGCELPCWWGIRPGENSWQSAQRTFLSLGKSVSSQQTSSLGVGHEVGLFGRHEPYPFDYVISHRLYERDNVVYLIGVTGYSLGWSPPQHFTQDWQRYSLDQVLARFGLLPNTSSAYGN
jgi:hypothetical protein